MNFSTLEKYDFCFSGYQVCIPTCWAQNKIQNQNLCLVKTIHTQCNRCPLALPVLFFTIQKPTGASPSSFQNISCCKLNTCMNLRNYTYEIIFFLIVQK